MARGTIKDGDTPILEDIEISLTTGRDRNGFGYWRGSFRLPRGKHIDATDEGYQLELDDGRVGRMLISRIDEPLVLFQGSGELKKPEPPEQAAQQEA